jgi:dTDP-4-amino-4,6-dideoxygalactose transaminase
VSDRPAILRGTPVRAGKSWPDWPQSTEGDRELLGEVLGSGAWSASNGEHCAAFADEFAAFQGAAHGLPLSNGTVTMEAALAACGVGEGDEVIVPGLTFVATASAALAVNATPVMVDVDPDSLCIDVAAAEAAVSERTKAVIPVHLGGRAADLDALVGLCSRHDLAMVEDCAHAPGTRWRGRGVGTHGAFGSFSFESHKLMTAGEGGALVTNDEALRDRAWGYSNGGRVPGGHWYHHATYGSNMRITEFQGALLRAQLKRYPEQQRIREERAALLDAELAKIPGVRPQSGDERMDRRGYYVYVFHYDNAEFAGLSHEVFAGALAEEGIPLGSCYPSLNTLELFRERRFEPRLRGSAPQVDYAALRLPHSEAALEKTVWLPHQVLLAEPDDVRDIARAIARIQTNAEAVSRGLGKTGAAAARLRGVASRLRNRRGD